MLTVTDLELSDLSRKANSNIRKRQHLNIHQNYSEVCQRFLNAIEPESYIRPHRHQTDPKNEMLVPINGLFAVYTFNDIGEILNLTYLSQKDTNINFSRLVEIPSNLWHTVIALEKGSVLLEIKAGPFNPKFPKDFAGWAPIESSLEAEVYLERLFFTAKNRLKN